jgi:hypothetical protein
VKAQDIAHARSGNHAFAFDDRGPRSSRASRASGGCRR